MKVVPSFEVVIEVQEVYRSGSYRHKIPNQVASEIRPHSLDLFGGTLTLEYNAA
jgi:hypothetical protein